MAWRICSQRSCWARVSPRAAAARTPRRRKRLATRSPAPPDSVPPPPAPCPRLVTVAIVDLFEVVQIQHHQAPRFGAWRSAP